MRYEARKLTDIEFPVYFSLIPDPGYDMAHLASFGIDGEFELFSGHIDNRTGHLGITWGGLNHSIKGRSLTL